MSIYASTQALLTSIETSLGVVSQRVRQFVPDAIVSQHSKRLYVDAVVGLDTNVGSQEHPLKTLEGVKKHTFGEGIFNIYLRRGQVHEIGAPPGHHNNGDLQTLIFDAYGPGVEKPTIRGVPVPFLHQPGASYHSAAFEVVTKTFLKFVNLRIETGVVPEGKQMYPGGTYGGFITRSGGVGETNTYDLVFTDCVIDVQDAHLFSPYIGSLRLSMVNTTVVSSKAVSYVLPIGLSRILDLNTVTVSGFGTLSLETLFGLRENNYIANVSNVTITN